MSISDEAVESAANAVRAAAWGHITPEDAAKRILEAADPHQLTPPMDESPRLPSAMRNQLFRVLGDFMEKFELESRAKGPTRHLDAPGYEWGDMCGDFERRVVAVLRAANVYGKPTP